MEKSVSTSISLRKLITAKQVADCLSISVHTVYKWAESGKLPSVKIGYLLRFDPDRIEKFIANGEAA
jgi:excisionase family DNA binding protein